MNKLSRSWSIFKKSFHLINAKRKLLIFPLISALAMLMLIGLIFGSIILYVISSESVEAGTYENSPISLIELAIYLVIYLISMIVTNFCNVAFFSEIIKGLNGEDVSVSRGFSFAVSRLKAIFLWSILASTVGVILRALEERMGLLGRIVIGLFGVAWAVASIFVIPALAMDPALNNPIEALKRSANTIKQTWGESIAGFVGFGMLNVLVMLGGIAVVVLLAIGITATAGTPFSYIGVGGIFLVILALFAYFYVASVARNVYIAALYLHSNGQPAVGEFTNEEFSAAFRQKKAKSSR